MASPTVLQKWTYLPEMDPATFPANPPGCLAGIYQHEIHRLFSLNQAVKVFRVTGIGHFV